MQRCTSKENESVDIFETLYTYTYTYNLIDTNKFTHLLYVKVCFIFWEYKVLIVNIIAVILFHLFYQFVFFFFYLNTNVRVIWILIIITIEIH